MATFDGAPLRRLGDGPVATVYLGQKGGVPVALKVFPNKLDKRTMAGYAKEQAKLATARVSSILMAAGLDELDTGEFAVRMEPCTQSLAALVDRTGAVPPADVVVLGRAVAEALAAAHGCGVVHGGMSPHNILFRTTGEPVLADVGVTLRQAFARDPLYAIEFLPPETLRTGTLDEKTDLYGLGAILHYALAGRSPHPGRLGEQPGERVLRILGEPVPALNDSAVPVGLATLVARLLSADPARRLGDARAVADQLGAMLPATPRSPAADDFDDFSAPRPTSPVPRAPAPAVPPYAPAPDGDDFDDFVVPGHATGSPVRRSAIPSSIPSPHPASFTPVPHTAPDGMPAEAPPTPAPVEYRDRPRPRVAGRPDAPVESASPAPLRGRARAKVLAGPLARPGDAAKKLVRYDLLAGGAILLALLALVPLLLFRGKADEPSSAPQVPPAAGTGNGDVEIVLEEPVELTDSVRLDWTADEELDFVVVVAAEGRKTGFEFPERKLTMTLHVERDLKYCFQVQATDGNENYKSNVVSLHGATCKE